MASSGRNKAKVMVNRKAKMMVRAQVYRRSPVSTDIRHGEACVEVLSPSLSHIVVEVTSG